jgi:putative membrane protein
MLLNCKIPLTYTFSKIKLEIIYTIIIWLTTFFLIREYAIIDPGIPVTVPAFIGTAIAVILSFKLNQAYDRWWEARKIWGSIVNESRTFVLQLQSFVKPPNDNEIRTLALRQIAWCFSLGQSLRGLNAVENLDKYLSVNELELISKHNNKPLAILQLNTKHIADLKAREMMDIFSQIQINNTLRYFSDAMGMAERIKSTVFPITYRLFLHWMIYLFTIVLSIALHDMAWYFEFPLLLAISCSFFLLEKAATQMQDPFSNKPTDTAVTTIATNIEINIRQLLGETEIPQAYPPNKFYSL